MDLPFYLINDKIYPRVTFVLDIINPGFGLTKYKIKKALESYQALCEDCGDTPQLDFPYKDADGNDSTVLDLVLANSKKEVEEAAEQGHRVHEMLEEHVSKGGMLDSSIEAKGFLEWQKKYKPKFLETEQTLFHPELGYAGTCDLICKIKGEIWLVDYKTTNKLYPKNGLQLTSYAMAKERISDMKIDHIACLQLGKNKKGFYFKEYDRRDNEVECAVKLFNWSNPNFVKNQEKALKSILEQDSNFKSHVIPVESLD